jgi:hypothetical protein
MKVKAANGLARALKAEGISRVGCYPTNPRAARSTRTPRDSPRSGA